MAIDLPTHARERLKGIRTDAHALGVFTSDFSVNEFLLVRKAGFEPVGLCWEPASTMSATSSGPGARARRWRSFPRRCITRANWR